jgi:ABC-type glycerol-3-phosphate transport system substrate-binding protein
VDISKYISKDTLEHYSSGISKQIGYIEDKLVSVPLFIDSEILYSNRKLLDRYDEKPPETWDELIRIASKIKKKMKVKKEMMT